MDHGAIRFRNVGKLTVIGSEYPRSKKREADEGAYTVGEHGQKRNFLARARARTRVLKAVGNHVRKSEFYHQSCRPNPPGMPVVFSESVTNYSEKR